MNLRLFIPPLLAGILTLTGCQALPLPTTTTAPAATQPVEIRFALKAGEQAVACSQPVQALGTTQSTVQINDLRFYISNPQLVNRAGEAVAVTLEQDGIWQHANTALLDFEDGTAGCADSGNAELNSVLRGTIPHGEYIALRFELGVPFDLNHQDVTVAESPLNLAPMWWIWQYGYKFVRIDMKTDAQESNGSWFIHLGSTGCAAANENTPPTAACALPNVAQIQLDGFDPAVNTVVADLATLLADVNLSESTPQPPGCMSGVDDPDCADLLPAFGLDPATGMCAGAGCATQTFFRVE